MNERERLITQGLNTVTIMCILLVSGRVLETFMALATGKGVFLALLMLGLSAWLAWNLYSGQLWARSVLAVLALFLIVQALFFMLGGVLIGEPIFFFAQFSGLLFSIGLIYVLFFYEPVQEYFRYVGGG